jgi:ATP-dependent helicase HrpB
MKCILAGFSDHLALRKDQGTLRCDVVHGRTGELARDSIVKKAPLFVAAEINEIESGRREINVLLSLATEVREEWLEELFPEDLHLARETRFDPRLKRVVVEHRRMFRDLVLSSRVHQNPPPEEAAAILAGRILRGDTKLPAWNEKVEQWITRLNCLAAWCPDLGLAPIRPEDRETLLQQICLGAMSARDLKDRPVWPVLTAWLAPGQPPLLDRYAPERLQLPGGRRARITYREAEEPFLSATIQDLYGLKQTPRIAMDRVPLVIHVLGPNRRPVQVTKDMPSFWREAYPGIRQELRKKYPKHEWKQDG